MDFDVSGWETGDITEDDGGWGLNSFWPTAAPSSSSSSTSSRYFSDANALDASSAGGVAVGRSPSAFGASHPGLASSDPQSLDQFDSLFILAQEFLLVTVLLIFILLGYSWSSQPQNRELFLNLYSFAPAICEPHASSRLSRHGFGDTFDGGSTLSASWIARRGSDVKHAHYLHARTPSTLTGFFPNPPPSEWNPIPFPSQLDFDNYFLQTWIDGDGDVVLGYQDSQAKNSSIIKQFGYVGTYSPVPLPRIGAPHLSFVLFNAHE